MSHKTSFSLTRDDPSIPSDSRIVFVSGYFNALHPGHVRLINFASDQGDYLIIGLLGITLAPDATNSVEERISAVSSIECVDQVVVLEEPPEKFISKFKPEIVVKGKEYESEFNSERLVVDSYGGTLIFSSGETKFSSIDLFRDEIHESNNLRLEKAPEFFNKHSLNTKDLTKILQKFSELKVIVIGDTIVDEYVNCDAEGMSQEDPTIVVRPLHSKLFLGGAGVVACHAHNLGSNVRFFSVIGDDEYGEFLKKQGADRGLDIHSLVDPSRPTTHKKRYRALGKTLLRVNQFIKQPISESLQQKLFSEIDDRLDETDLLVFSDFNYGILPQKLIDNIVKSAKKKDVLVAADSQSSSQTGDVSRFRGAKLLTPTEREARLSLQNYDDGLVTLAEKLRRKTSSEHVFITLGNEGLLIHTTEIPSKISAKWLTDQLPAMNRLPRDPAGGGDALLIISALAMAAGASVWEAAYLGSIGAACQVGRVGNIPLTYLELMAGLE